MLSNGQDSADTKRVDGAAAIVQTGAMDHAVRLLSAIATHGRWCLVLGLVAGFLLPEVAGALRPALPLLVGALLFLTAMRVGAGDAIGELARSRRVLGQVLILQAVAPFGLLVVLLSLDAEITPFLLAVVLMLSAPSVTGAPNFAIMTGGDPAPAMRILVLGTALFPILVLPIFWLLPQLGGTAGLWASARLVAVILIAVGAGFAVRHLAGDRIGPAQIRAFDGLNALALGVIVVALMSAIGPLLQENPGRLMTWLIAVFAVNFGLQLFVFASYRGEGRAAVSMIAGNRNIALFLIALPETVVDPLLIFIGCYQIPMYLTPILLRRLYAPS